MYAKKCYATNQKWIIILLQINLMINYQQQDEEK